MGAKPGTDAITGRHETRSRTRLVALAVMALITLSACGGGKDFGARIVKAVLARQAAGTSHEALDAKLSLAKFFNARILPEAGAHLARLSSGAEPLMELAAASF